VKIGQWSFIEEQVDLNTTEDVESFRKKLENIPNKEWSVVKLDLKGSLTLSLHGILQNHLLAAKMSGGFRYQRRQSSRGS
jgi:hypothetical protein